MKSGPFRMRLSATLAATLAAAGLFLLSAAAPAFAWEATFLRAADGDSFTVRRADDGRRVDVRLYGVDAPEQGQPFGQAARRSLIALLEGRALEVRPMEEDPYRRVVAVVLASPRDGTAPVCVNAEQIAKGMAWYYGYFCTAPFCGEWKALERTARTERRGLWQDKNPMPPREWRKRHPR